MSKPTVLSMGCRLNTYEAEIVRRHVADAGLDDTVIVNTCAVTGESVRQASQAIRRLRRDRPSARIIVTGCAAQVEPDRFAAMPEVDHVIGNAEKLSSATFAGIATGSTERVLVNDIMSVRETAPQFVGGYASKARAIVQVQNGCDHRCTFCIIPFARGRSRSVPAGEVVAQIRRLTELGYQEIVLTGVDISCYGPDLPGEMTLGRLVAKILKHVPDLKRLRLSSIDQVEIDQDLLAAIADEPRLMPHLHLSMQAGDDMILKRMKRRHLSADAIRFCQEARRLRPDVVFGADLIAGFPTETDAMFANTLGIVDACDLTYLHVFPYSSRKGTPAALMPQVERPRIKVRAAMLRAKGQFALERYLARQVSETVEVLMELGGIGRTPQFAEVEGADVSRAKPGSFVTTQITGYAGGRLQAGAVA